MLSHSYESIPDAPESGPDRAGRAGRVHRGVCRGGRRRRSLARPADAMLDSKLRGSDAAIIVTELTTYTPTGTPSLKPASGCARPACAPPADRRAMPPVADAVDAAERAGVRADADADRDAPVVAAVPAPAASPVTSRPARPRAAVDAPAHRQARDGRAVGPARSPADAQVHPAPDPRATTACRRRPPPMPTASPVTPGPSSKPVRADDRATSAADDRRGLADAAADAEAVAGLTSRRLLELRL